MTGKNIFYVLGGGESPGASCYFLEVDGCKFLLDCGASAKRHRLPDFAGLFRERLDGINELAAVFVSHAHADHIAALPYLAAYGLQRPIYANPVTLELTRLGFSCRDHLGQRMAGRLRESWELAKERCLGLFQGLPFGRKVSGAGWEAVLYPAGHIPGAAMIYIRTEHHRILYTGDFSARRELLGGAYHLPEDLEVDLLVTEGTRLGHGAEPEDLSLTQERIFAALSAYGAVAVTAAQLTKGIELARFLDARFEELGKDVPIYLSPKLSGIAEALERAHFRVFSPRVRPMPQGGAREGVFIGSSKDCPAWPRVTGELCLHAPGDEVEALLGRLRPAGAFVVHGGDRRELKNLQGAATLVSAQDGCRYEFS